MCWIETGSPRNGMGMDGHEWPYLVKHNMFGWEQAITARPGMVFSDEPGIYIRGEFGVRLEDDMYITANGAEPELRGRLTAPSANPSQPLYVSAPLPGTQRVMVKDEDVCVHCGLCAERCPTAAWDMQKSSIRIPLAADQEIEHA